MKKFIAFTLLAVMSLSLAGCSTLNLIATNSPGDKIRETFANYLASDELKTLITDFTLSDVTDPALIEAQKVTVDTIASRSKLKIGVIKINNNNGVLTATVSGEIKGIDLNSQVTLFYKSVLEILETSFVDGKLQLTSEEFAAKTIAAFNKCLRKAKSYFTSIEFNLAYDKNEEEWLITGSTSSLADAIFGNYEKAMETTSNFQVPDKYISG